MGSQEKDQRQEQNIGNPMHQYLICYLAVTVIAGKDERAAELSKIQFAPLSTKACPVSILHPLRTHTTNKDQASSTAQACVSSSRCISRCIISQAKARKCKLIGYKKSMVGTSLMCIDMMPAGSNQLLQSQEKHVQSCHWDTRALESS